MYSCNKKERAEKFQQLFADGLVISMPSSYWLTNTSNNFSKSDKHCDDILKCFIKRWNGELTRSEYLKKFSTDNWKKISSEEKEFHSLSNCRQCATEHLDFQKSFPSLPIFEMAESQPNIIEINLSSTSGTSSTRDEAEVTREVLATLDMPRNCNAFGCHVVIINFC